MRFVFEVINFKFNIGELKVYIVHFLYIERIGPWISGASPLFPFCDKSEEEPWIHAYPKS